MQIESKQQILERRKEIEQEPPHRCIGVWGGSPWRNFSGEKLLEHYNKAKI